MYEIYTLHFNVFWMEFNLSTLYVYTLSQKFNRIRILSTSGCNKNLKTIERREEACKFDMHVSLTPHSFDISSASNTSLSTVIVIFSIFFNFYVV